MFRLSCITLLFALACTARPFINIPRSSTPATLQMAKRYNFTHSNKIAEHDRARFQALSAAPQRNPNRLKSRDGPAAVTNVLVSYNAKVLIGSPPTEYELIVDTGSSNTWVGAGKPYVHSDTSQPTTNAMAVRYGSGSFEGVEMYDLVRIGDISIPNQPIGVATSHKGFVNIDGILGLGPERLTQGTLVDYPDEMAPTVIDTAASDSLISSRVIGVSFAPVTQNGDVNGELTFGYVDASKYEGTLNTMSVTTSEPAGHYVGIDQSITYGDEGTMILEYTSGIVDTGTTLLLLPTDAYNKYVQATGATYDDDVGLLSISADQYRNLKSMFFYINGEMYELISNAQLWPRSLNEDLGGSSDKIYLIVGDGGCNVGDGLDFINGQAFLERFYTMYNSDTREFGIAKTLYTYEEIN